MTNHRPIQERQQAFASETAAANGLQVKEFCEGHGVLMTMDARATANALSAQMVSAIQVVLDDARRRDVHVVAITGRGHTFCGGFDLAALETASDADLTGRFLAIQRMLDSLRSAPFVTVAFVNGAAVGAGADLAVACDYRLGTGNSRFRFPGVRFGLLLGTHNLVQVVGRKRALDILLRQQAVPAAEALDYSLLTGLCTTGNFEPFLIDLCEATSRLSHSTLRSLLEVIRGAPTNPTVTLVESFGTDGLAKRMRSYIQPPTSVGEPTRSSGRVSSRRSPSCTDRSEDAK